MGGGCKSGVWDKGGEGVAGSEHPRPGEPRGQVVGGRPEPGPRAHSPAGALLSDGVGSFSRSPAMNASFLARVLDFTCGVVKKKKKKKKRLDYLSYSLDQKESEKTSGLFFFSPLIRFLFFFLWNCKMLASGWRVRDEEGMGDWGVVREVWKRLFHYLFHPQRRRPHESILQSLRQVGKILGLKPQKLESKLVSWHFWMREAPEGLSGTWGWGDGTFGNFMSCFVSSPPLLSPSLVQLQQSPLSETPAVRFRNTSGLSGEDRALEWASRPTWFWSSGGALGDSGLSRDKHLCVRRKAGRVSREVREALKSASVSEGERALLLASVSPSALGELSSYLLLQKWFPPPYIAHVPSLPHIKSWISFFFFLGWI